jgi:dephospho-CoA kinase
MERLLSKRAFSKSQIARRIKAQMPQEAKRRLADFVIDNSKTINETKRQVEAIRRLLWRN